MPGAFISYAREDQEKVDRLHRDLRTCGVSAWLDRERINPGVPWQVAITEAIAAGSFFVACLSKAYLEKAAKRTFVREEIEIGLERSRSPVSVRPRFVPVRLEDCEVSNEMANLYGELRALQWIDLFPDWAGGVRLLADSIHPLTAGFEVTESWAHKEGNRNSRQVNLDLSSAFGSTRVFNPPEEFQNSIWTHSALWRILVRGVEGADLNRKRVGIIRSHYDHRHGETAATGQTVIAEYKSTRPDGIEEWEAHERWQTDGSASQIVASRLAVIAWYQDGLGHTYYDDNNGRGYFVTWEPNLYI